MSAALGRFKSGLSGFGSLLTLRFVFDRVQAVVAFVSPQTVAHRSSFNRRFDTTDKFCLAVLVLACGRGREGRGFGKVEIGLLGQAAHTWRRRCFWHAVNQVWMMMTEYREGVRVVF